MVDGRAAGGGRRVLAGLHALATASAPGLGHAGVEAAIAAAPKALGEDQAGAVRTLCGPGPALRALVAPAGHGKTTTVAAAVAAARDAGRSLVVAAPTHKAVAELRAAGVEATTVARLRLRLPDRPLAPRTVVVVDEVSQLATRDAEVLVAAVAATPGAQLWCLGDARQAQAVAAGGLVVEVERLGAAGTIPAPPSPSTAARSTRPSGPPWLVCGPATPTPAPPSAPPTAGSTSCRRRPRPARPWPPRRWPTPTATVPSTSPCWP